MMLRLVDSQKRLALLAALFVFALIILPPRAEAKPWVMCYFPGWELGNGSTNSTPPLSAVDFSSMTAVAYFGFSPNPDGTIDTTYANYKAARLLAAAAHAKGAKALVSIGGWNTESGFESATDSAIIGTFVSNIMALVREYDFDGVDIDWETYSGPIPTSDYPNFTNLANMLRDSLDAMRSGMLLTSTSSGGNQSLMADTQKYFNEINLMTYDLSAEYGGWPTWYNSALYSDGDSLDGQPLPNANSIVRQFEEAGVDSSKIGIGCEFAGTVWEGASLPDVLPLTVTLSSSSDVPLYNSSGTGIMQKYFNPAYYHWDPLAQVGYLSIPAGILSLLSPSYFISFDDSNSIAAKFNYIRKNHLGGLIIYELGWGYPPGSPNYPLMEAVKNIQADTSTTVVSVPPSGVPSSPYLHQNYPNPFNPSTTIQFGTTSAGRVRVVVYNILGQRVAILFSGFLQPGEHALSWDANAYPSGVYLCRLQTSSARLSIKMLLLK